MLTEGWSFKASTHHVAEGSKIGLGSNIGNGLFVGWVEHPDIFWWVSFLNPTYLPAIFVISETPNKMAEDRIIPAKLVCPDRHQNKEMPKFQNA